MKVSEFIAKLQELPPDADIKILNVDPGCGCCSGDDSYEEPDISPPDENCPTYFLF